MNVTIVGMIYKSVNWLAVMNHYMLSDKSKSTKHNVDYVVIANDATEDVRKYLHESGLKWFDYRDPKPNDYYLNRVYRAWNIGGFNSPGDVIVFVNSDMIPYDGRLDNLLDHLTEDTLPCSLLIESGKLRSGQNALSVNCGQNLEQFSLEKFNDVAKSCMSDSTLSGGLYMPCAFYKKDFIEAGGYPEGNIYQAGPGRIDTPLVMSGDDYFFHHNPVMSKKKHITVMNSVMYHFQTGEMDS